MIPKYTINEIITMLKQHADTPAHLLSINTIWTAKDYELAAQILSLDITELTSMLPAENLSSISFRATENTEAINNTVEQVNAIFDLLTYQLKIGQVK